MANGEAALDHERWMRAALSFGRRGLGRTAPNPAVGALVVKDGIVLGRGVTAPGGRPHAEPLALAEAGPAARGATLYVTLEPCSHYGRTPPCTSAIIEAGIATVVYALGDPDPRVAGKGLAQLHEAGIAVVGPVAADDARQDHRGHVARVTTGRPSVTLKMAETADGIAAAPAGAERLRITGPAASAAVHRMRLLHDAVMVGIGTALADDPLLTVRLPGVTASPTRVVLDSRLRLPPEAALVRSLADAPLIVVTAEDTDAAPAGVLEARGVTVLRAAGGRHGLDLDATLRMLGGHGFTRLFCEGGPTLASALVMADLADVVVTVTSDRTLDAPGRPAFHAPARRMIVDSALYTVGEDRWLGEDRLRSFERIPSCSPDS